MPLFVTYDFEPDLSQVRLAMLDLEKRLENKTQLMALATVAAKHDVERNFNEEHDSFGKVWADWKPSYAAVAKRRPNRGLMDRDGKSTGLRKKASSNEAFKIIKGKLFYDVGVTERSYGITHLSDYIFYGKDESVYVRPARSWLPFSAFGAESVNKAFQAWAEGNARLSIQHRTSKLGKKYTQVQYRTPGGQYGSRAV